MIRLTAVRLGVVSALLPLLLLPGCGRKGALDPPPVSRQYQPSAPASAPGSGSGPTEASREGFDQEGRPVAPPGPKAHRFLDWLLD